MSMNNLDMIRATLGVLGVLGAAQVIEAEDEAVIRRYLRATVNGLADREVCHLEENYWYDNEVGMYEDRYLTTLPRIVAGHAAAHYGLPNADALKTDATVAEVEIMAARRSGNRGKQPMHPEYF